MKKLVTWAIVLILCFSISGCGSKKEEIKELEGDFTIHAGVKFGDTAEEVKNKETLELRFDDSKSEAIQCKIMRYTGELAGHTASALEYRFDEDGKVIRATYNLRDTDEEGYFTNGKGTYDNIYKMMIEKYGNPINKYDYKYLFINEYIKGLENLKKNGAIISYKVDGWLLKYKSYYVEIVYDMLEAEYQEKNKGTFEYNTINYVYHTNEEIEESKEAIEREKEEKENREKRAIDDL